MLLGFVSQGGGFFSALSFLLTLFTSVQPPSPVPPGDFINFICSFRHLVFLELHILPKKSGTICFCFRLQCLTHCQHSHWSNPAENKSCFFQFWHLHVFMRRWKSTTGFFFPPSANTETVISNRFTEFWLGSRCLWHAPCLSNLLHTLMLLLSRA